MKYRTPTLNDIEITGRLVETPNKRTTKTGQSVLNTRIAHTHKFKTKDGKWDENVSFIPVVFWGLLADKIADKGQKGFPVLVTGRISTNKYTVQKEGQEPEQRQNLEVTALGVQILGAVDTVTEPTEEVVEETTEVVEEEAI